MSGKFERHFDALIDFKRLEKFCLVPERYFHRFGEQRGKDWMERHTFKDNGASVLAVAHTDIARSIQRNSFKRTYNTGRIFSPALDDRLGCYIILDILPKLGINVDILLTHGEEIGMTTAAFFRSKKEYNWIFQFDRRGTDVVQYQYRDSLEWDRALRKAEWDIKHGSFSDIGALEHLGVCGANFGAGYHQEHTQFCTAFLSDVSWNVERFANFYEANKDTRFIHEPKPKYTPTYGGGAWSRPFRDDHGQGWEGYGGSIADQFPGLAAEDRHIGDDGINWVWDKDIQQYTPVRRGRPATKRAKRVVPVSNLDAILEGRSAARERKSERKLPYVSLGASSGLIPNWAVRDSDGRILADEFISQQAARRWRDQLVAISKGEQHGKDEGRDDEAGTPVHSMVPLRNCAKCGQPFASKEIKVVDGRELTHYKCPQPEKAEVKA